MLLSRSSTYCKLTQAKRQSRRRKAVKCSDKKCTTTYERKAIQTLHLVEVLKARKAISGKPAKSRRSKVKVTRSTHFRPSSLYAPSGASNIITQKVQMLFTASLARHTIWRSKGHQASYTGYMHYWTVKRTWFGDCVNLTQALEWSGQARRSRNSHG